MSHEPTASSSRRIPFISGGVFHDNTQGGVQRTASRTDETQAETQGTTNQSSSANEGHHDPIITSAHANSTSDSPRNESVGENIISAELIQSLENIVECFRRGEINKARAISRLVSALSISDDSVDEPAKEAALTQYISSIDSFSQLHSRSARYGEIVDNELRSDRNHSTDHDEIEKIISDIAASSKRGNSIEEEETEV